MTNKEAKRVRTLGKVLFILYIFFLVYFLFLSDWYGREGVMEDYHYNLVLFREIKRFILYRNQLGTFAVFLICLEIYLFLCLMATFLQWRGKEKVSLERYFTVWV